MKHTIRLSADLELPKTRIMATIGRASMEYDKIEKMVLSGATIIRINAAHIRKSSEIEAESKKNGLTCGEAETVIKNIQRLRERHRCLIGIYLDLGGPKIRVAKNFPIIVPHNRTGKEKYKPSIKDKVIFYSKNKISAFNDHPKSEPKSFGIILDVDSFEKIESPDESENEPKILLKDGWCELIITKKVDDHELHAKVLEVNYDDFEFRPGIGANPTHYKFPRIITEKDEYDILWGLKMGVNFISLSFVCSPSDADTLRDIIKAKKKEIRDKREKEIRDKKENLEEWSLTYQKYIKEDYQIPIFAKIETIYAVDPEKSKEYEKEGPQQEKDYDPEDENEDYDPLIEIIRKFDGVMVARGDLAVEVGKYQVPSLQERIIREARLQNKPVIVATEMLESMKKGGASTRAEIQDINTAVRQEADILMLSGETASTEGEPHKAVDEIRKAIKQAEKDSTDYDKTKNFQELQERRSEYHYSGEEDEDLYLEKFSVAQGNQVCVLANVYKSEYIICSVTTGRSAKNIAYYRPSQKILAITSETLDAIRLLPFRGIYPIRMEGPLLKTIGEYEAIATEMHKIFGLKLERESTEEELPYFRVPGLLRIKSEFPDPDSELPQTPNSIHEFRLLVERKKDPHMERKYILSAASHESLVQRLKQDARKWRLLEQQNFYFSDKKGIIFQKKGLLRIRLEKTVAESEPDQPLPPRRIFLTLKGPEKPDKVWDATKRAEKEYDVSRLIPDDSFKDFFSRKEVAGPYRDDIWNWFNQFTEAFESEYINSNTVPYELLTQIMNERYTFEMRNGFIFELDKTYFGKDIHYELEIELNPYEHDSELLNEYVQDKFEALRIPIDCPRRYPSKALRAYYYGCYKGQLEPKVVEWIEKSVKVSDPDCQ